MTKTEYREYISGAYWREKRRIFLELHSCCNRCELPRRLAVIAYDEDLHVHHASYARVGHELDSDLEALCKRCHEIETFGYSSLHAPRRFPCNQCEAPCFDPFERHCDQCREILLMQQWEAYTGERSL